MLTRAGASLDATAQRWNRFRWRFLLTEQVIGLVAPFSVSGCSATVGTSTITTSTSNGFLNVLVDDVVQGGGIRPETLISATGATSLSMAVTASATVTGAVFTFSRPLYALASDYKSMYDVRLLGAPRPLYYQPRRLYDNQVLDQTSPSTTYGYDLYLEGDRGKIRMTPPPGGADSVVVRYYRRMTMPSQTSTNGLDIPQDYEDVFVAAAKAHFLIDKGQPHREQWDFWRGYAENGLKEIRKDERIVDDENMTLQPPLPQRIYSPNSPFYWYERNL